MAMTIIKSRYTCGNHFFQLLCQIDQLNGIHMISAAKTADQMDPITKQLSI